MTKSPLPKFFGRHWLSLATLTALLLSLWYWGLVASDRYVSTAHILIQNTGDAASTGAGLAAMLGGAAAGMPTEQSLLRDYLLSPDLLKKLDAKLDLRGHYSRPEHDLLSRLWDKATTQEQFHYYYLNRVSAEMDNYAGVLVVKAQGYDPATAHAIAAFLVAEGERFMDALARGLAQSQVDFLAQETQKMHAAVIASRDALLAFQNKHNLVSPKAATEATAATVSRLESQLADLETRRTALLGYLMPGSAGVAELNLQIDALGKQIASEKAKLTSPAGKTLNVTMEAYQRLEMDAQFAQDTYHAALSALEKGRIEAARTLKKMSVIQQPSLPEYSEEPRRLYNSTVFAALILIVAGVVHLLAAIIRDHKD
jgi:capsular polysaccharide transport system permease protein